MLLSKLKRTKKALKTGKKVIGQLSTVPSQSRNLSDKFDSVKKHYADFLTLLEDSGYKRHEVASFLESRLYEVERYRGSNMAKMNMSDCYECQGKGGWIDSHNQQSVICPVCRPLTAETFAIENCDLSGWITSRWKQHQARWFGPMLQHRPWLLVIHSPIYSDHVARYFENPIDKNGNFRKVSTHIAREGDVYDQCVPFNRVSWNCGGSLLNGNRRLNYCSHSIETIPIKRKWTSQEKDSTRASLVYMFEQNRYQIIVPHSFIDPGKQDPGKYFPWEICEDLGAEIPHLK